MTASTPGASIPPASLFVLRWIGYGLLFFAFVDLLSILYPPDFLDPFWEFQVIGQLVERAPVPLIGFGLVFLTDPTRRPRFEQLLMRGLSVLTIVLALVFLALVPLGIANTFRIDNRNVSEIDEQANQRLERLAQFEEAVDRAEGGQVLAIARSNPEVFGDLESLRERVEGGLGNTEAVKAELEENLGSVRGIINGEAIQEKSLRRRRLLENSVKWNLGALVTSALFALIFRGTAGMRRPLRPRPVASLETPPEAASE